MSLLSTRLCSPFVKLGPRTRLLGFIILHMVESRSEETESSGCASHKMIWWH